MLYIFLSYRKKYIKKGNLLLALANDQKYLVVVIGHGNG